MKLRYIALPLTLLARS